MIAGTEYTVEILKGDYYQNTIGENIPDVEIINPQGNALSFDVSEEETGSLNDDVIGLSVYPPAAPYVICLTFTPVVTGRYTIKLSHVSSTEDVVEDDVITLFVYKELRNEDTGEAGYYERYKLYDKDGNPSATLSMNDVMTLRKAWNEAADRIMQV